jgi:hypothetical protein
MVDLDALGNARLRSAPYRWGYVTDSLGRETAARLRATFPSSDYWRLRRDHEGSPMDVRIRCLVPLGGRAAVLTESLDRAWVEFVDELVSDSYREMCADVFGVDLDGAELEVSAWRWGVDARIGPHRDIPRKIATQVFYLNDDWEPAWGGCLNILASPDPEDVVAELPPALGSSSLILRSDSSWHSVSPVQREANQQRLSVTATWQHPGSESTFWTVEEGGHVRCHAPGSGPDRTMPGVAGDQPPVDLVSNRQR